MKCQDTPLQLSKWANETVSCVRDRVVLKHKYVFTNRGPTRTCGDGKKINGAAFTQVRKMTYQYFAFLNLTLTIAVFLELTKLFHCYRTSFYKYNSSSFYAFPYSLA